MDGRALGVSVVVNVSKGRQLKFLLGLSIVSVALAISFWQEGRLSALTPLSEAEIALAKSLAPPKTIANDPSNRWSGSELAQEVGRILFFSKQLSPAGISCSSCHDPDRGFADSKPLSHGVGMTIRHSPSLLFSGFHRWFFWDGRADSLWAQAMGPIENPSEMGSSRTYMAKVIVQNITLWRRFRQIDSSLPAQVDFRHWPEMAHPGGSEEFHQAWDKMNREDRNLIDRIFVMAVKTIAAFEEILLPPDSKVAKFFRQPQEWPGDRIVQGFRLFKGKGRCITCHHGQLLSDLEFHNLGLSVNPLVGMDFGRYTGIARLENNPFRTTGPWSDGRRPQLPEGKIRQTAEQRGQFKTPSLWGVSQTPPYMHDGRFTTLEEVLEFYNTMPSDGTIGHRESFLRPIGLTSEEKAHTVGYS